MKVYITQYALTQGIITVENAESCIDVNIIKVSFSNDWYHNYFHKPNWHETWEEALEQAIKMKNKKIESLRKKIKKIRSFRISPLITNINIKKETNYEYYNEKCFN